MWPQYKPLSVYIKMKICFSSGALLFLDTTCQSDRGADRTLGHHLLEAAVFVFSHKIKKLFSSVASVKTSNYLVSTYVTFIIKN